MLWYARALEELNSVATENFSVAICLANTVGQQRMGRNRCSSSMRQVWSSGLHTSHTPRSQCRWIGSSSCYTPAGVLSPFKRTLLHIPSDAERAVKKGIAGTDHTALGWAQGSDLSKARRSRPAQTCLHLRFGTKYDTTPAGPQCAVGQGCQKGSSYHKPLSSR